MSNDAVDMKGQPIRVGDTVVAGTMAGLITGKVVDIGFSRYKHKLEAKISISDWHYYVYIEDLMVINKQLSYFKETYPELQV